MDNIIPGIGHRISGNFMLKKILLFTSSYAIWLLLNWPADAPRLVIGILAAAFVTYVTGDMFSGGQGTSLKDLRRPFLYFFCYVPIFFAGMIRASLFVAYRILHPDLPICPGIVRIKTSLKNNIALTCFANSLTLTSGGHDR